MGIFDFIKRLLRSEPLPPADQGHDLDELARRLGLSVEALQQARPAYTRYEVPKRSGGNRVIHAPTGEFKGLQRRVLRRLLSRLPVHPAATGFEPGKSIVTHALPHAMRRVVVKLDIREFFPSTAARRVNAYFRYFGWNKQTADLLVRWCTLEGGLPQGAPTSPRLSNLVNYRMDVRLNALALRGPANIRYSRYADDITLSFDVDVHSSVNSTIYAAKGIVEDEGYRLHTRKKLRIMRQHDRQQVTGLVVNAGVNLPREARRWLRAVEHHRATRGTCTLTDAELEGWRSFRAMIVRQSKA